MCSTHLGFDTVPPSSSSHSLAFVMLSPQGFLGLPRFLLSGDIHSIATLGSLSSIIHFTCSNHIVSFLDVLYYCLSCAHHLPDSLISYSISPRYPTRSPKSISTAVIFLLSAFVSFHVSASYNSRYF